LQILIGLSLSHAVKTFIIESPHADGPATALPTLAFVLPFHRGSQSLHCRYPRFERDRACARRHGSDALRSGRSGLPALRAQDWVGEIGKGLTTVTVKVRQPEVTHIVKIQDFENWLNSRGKTPAEIVLKSRLRQLLGMKEQ